MKVKCLTLKPIVSRQKKMGKVYPPNPGSVTPSGRVFFTYPTKHSTTVSTKIVFKDKREIAV